MAKNIIICSDGTGNTAIKGRGTNVFKLFEAVDLHSHRVDPHPEVPTQIAFYDDGVGTESFKPLKLLGGAVGWGLSRNVMQLYRELARVYDHGDNIYLFGFSRGAFTVRTLAGMIVHCGVLRGLELGTTHKLREAVSQTYKAYRAEYQSYLTRLVRRKPGRPNRKAAVEKLHGELPFHLNVPIRFIGVWDTVDAVGMPFALGEFVNRVVYQFKFSTRDLNGQVKCGCQALAIDEERTSFAPVLWDERRRNPEQMVEQVWFAGVHSNVGGGYPKQGMSLVALDWMLRRAMECGLRVQPLDLELIKGHASVDDKLYDPRAGAGLFYSWGPRKIGELCEANGVAPKIHLTAIERIAHGTEDYAPGVIPDGAVVVTTTTDDPEANAATEMRARAVQKILDKALADRPTLMREAAPAMKVGRLSYWLFMLSWLALIIGAVGVTMETIPGPLTVGRMIKGVWAVVYSLVTLQLDVVFETLLALLYRPWRALGVTAFGGFLVAWVLARRTDRQISDIFSAFWHKQQEELRDALKSARAAAARQYGGFRPAPREPVEVD